MESRNTAKRRERVTDSNLLFAIAAVIFVLMYGVGMLSHPHDFLQAQTFFDFFNLNGALIILTLGESIVMVGGSIDISIGQVTALVTVSCALFLQSGTGSVGGALLLALGIGIAFGLLQGFLIAYLKIQPFIITLAGMFLASGLVTTIHENPISVTMPAFVHLMNFQIVIPWLGTLNRLGRFIPLSIDLATLVVLFLAVALVTLMNWSRFGRNLYAVGGNYQSALMLGINAKRTRFYSHVLCGLLAGVAGFVFLMSTGAGNVGNAYGFEIKAIAGSIIGGTLLIGGVGNLIGSPIGALTLLAINELIRVAGVNSDYQAIVSGLLLCFFIVLQNVVMRLRGTDSFKLALPGWLLPARRAR